MYFFKGQCKLEDNVMFYSNSTLSEISVRVARNQLHYGIYTPAF